MFDSVMIIIFFFEFMLNLQLTRTRIRFLISDISDTNSGKTEFMSELELQLKAFQAHVGFLSFN